MATTAGPVIPTILVAGQPLDDLYDIVSIDVEREVNRIPTARIMIGSLGGADAQTRLLGGGPFAPAAEVRITFRLSGSDLPVFSGLVAGIGARAAEAAPLLEISLKDKAIGLAGARQNRVFTDQTDADAIRKVVEQSGLRMGDAPTTQPAHKTLVQYNATDWDFIVSRADAQGLVVAVKDGTVSLKKMTVEGSAAHTFSFGRGDIGDLQFSLDLTGQHAAVNGRAWDPSNLGPASPDRAPALALTQGGRDVATASDKLSLGNEQLVHMVPMPHSEVRSWASGRMARARLALIRGRIAVAGIPAADLMEIANLEGLGDRFSGKALITGVRHRLDARGYATDIQFGLPSDPFGQLPDIAEAGAHGLLPPISGLQLGTVTSADADPDGEARVRIQVAAIAADPPQQLWARIAKPDAGPKSGFCFFPEAGDEVVVGFLDNDPRYPIVLGLLHGSKNTPPDGFTDTKQKGIVTKHGVKIAITEADKPSVTIETKNGRKFMLDDDGAAVTLADRSGNTISLTDSGGVTIKSAKDLTIEASGAVKIKAATIDLN